MALEWTAAGLLINNIFSRASQAKLLAHQKKFNSGVVKLMEDLYGGGSNAESKLRLADTISKLARAYELRSKTERQTAIDQVVEDWEQLSGRKMNSEDKKLLREAKLRSNRKSGLELAKQYAELFGKKERSVTRYRSQSDTLKLEAQKFWGFEIGRKDALYNILIGLLQFTEDDAFEIVQLLESAGYLEATNRTSSIVTGEAREIIVKSGMRSQNLSEEEITNQASKVLPLPT